MHVDDQADQQPSKHDTADHASPTHATTPVDDSAGAIAKRLGPAGVLGVLWAFLPAAGGFLLLARLGPVSDFLNQHQTMGLVIYIAAFTISAGLGLLPTYAQAILAGYAFGVTMGVPAALAGFVGASLVGWLVARRVSAGRIDAEIRRHPRLSIVRDALVRHGTARSLAIVTLLRIPPNSPFALTNLVLSTSGVGLLSYVVGTAVGMLPRTAVAVVIGSQIEGALSKDAIGTPLWLRITGVVVSLLVIIIIGAIAKRVLDRVVGTPADPSANRARD